MGYESLHIMELLSVQCLQVDDVILIIFLCHPYIPYFLIQRIFCFLVSFLFYCMHACTVTRCTVVIVVWPPRYIGLVLGQSWMVIPMNKLSPVVCKCMLIENAVVYMKNTLFTKSYVQKYFLLYFIVRIVIVYMYITLFERTSAHWAIKT